MTFYALRLLRQASEKRQGTKSRAGRGGFAAAISGGLAIVGAHNKKPGCMGRAL